CLLLLPLMLRHAPLPTRFPYTTLFRSDPFIARFAATTCEARPVPAHDIDDDARVGKLAGLGDDGQREVRLDAELLGPNLPGRAGDRKSTRLNSSHVKISYAVFCLKKKK